MGVPTIHMIYTYSTEKTQQSCSCEIFCWETVDHPTKQPCVSSTFPMALTFPNFDSHSVLGDQWLTFGQVDNMCCHTIKSGREMNMTRSLRHLLGLIMPQI